MTKKKDEQKAQAEEQEKPKKKRLPPRPIPKSYEKRIRRGDSLRGRDTTYTKEFGQLVCERIATIPLSTRRICEMFDDMPNHTTIYLWVYKYPDFADAYVVAKQTQSKIKIDELEDLYDTIGVVHDKEGNQRLDAATVAHINNKASHVRWCAAKLAPGLFGSSSTVTVKNSEDEERVKKEILEKRKELEAQFKKDY